MATITGIPSTANSRVAEDSPQFFSPKRKRMASKQLVNTHVHHLNESEMTDAALTSFASASTVDHRGAVFDTANMRTARVFDPQSVDSSEVCDSLALTFGGSTPFAAQDKFLSPPIVCETGDRLTHREEQLMTAMTNLSATTDTASLSSSSIREDMVYATTAPRAIYATAAVPHVAQTTEHTVDQMPRFRPATLFPTSDSESVRKPRHRIGQPAAVGQTEGQSHDRSHHRQHVHVQKPSVVCGNIFANMQDDDSPQSQFAASCLSPVRNNTYSWRAGHDFSDRDSSSDQRLADISDENVERLLSESDGGIDITLSPQRFVNHDNGVSSFNSNGYQSEAKHLMQSDDDFTSMICANPSPIAASESVSQQSVQSTRQRILSQSEQQRHDNWLTEHVSNFTRSCDLNHKLDERTTQLRKKNCSSMLNCDDDQDDSCQRLSNEALPDSDIQEPQRMRSRLTSPIQCRSSGQSIALALFPSSPTRVLGDLGTPVTERGSPAVLEGLHYDDEDEDEGELGTRAHISRSIFQDLEDELGTETERKASTPMRTDCQKRQQLLHQLLNDEEDDELRRLDYSGEQDMSSPQPIVPSSACKVRRTSKTVYDCSPMRLASSNGGSHNTSSNNISSGLDIHQISSPLRIQTTGNSNQGSAHRLLRANSNNSMGSTSSTSNMSLSDKSRSHNTSLRPLPDPSAFDIAVSTRLNNSSEFHLGSPVCPATPSRAWNHNSSLFSQSSFYQSANSSSGIEGIHSTNDHLNHGHNHGNSAISHLNNSMATGSSFLSESYDDFAMSPSVGLDNDWGAFGDLHSRAPPITRHNSLMENKLLLTQSEDGSPRGDVAFYRDFVVEGIIGQGTFAEVYKVRAIHLSTRKGPSSMSLPLSARGPPSASFMQPIRGSPIDDTQRDRSLSIDLRSVSAADRLSQSSPIPLSMRSSVPRPANPFDESENARQTRQSQHFAVKKIKREFRSKKDREWLLNEVRVMKLVNRTHCPYIIPFVRAWQEDNHFFVQLGLAEKGTLKDLAHSIASKKLTMKTSTLLHVVHDVSAGLAHVHSCGIVHLDIKPANLLINESGRILIGDFGMASEIGSKDDSLEGDTRYMAPELLNISDRLASADIFSLGISVYELCFTQAQISKGTLLLPTEGPLWHKLRQGEADPVENRPDYLAQLIRDMMHPDPAARPLASQIVALPQIADASAQDDEDLLAANPCEANLAASSGSRLSGRGMTFHPILRMGSVSESENAAYMAELLARAITPH